MNTFTTAPASFTSTENYIPRPIGAVGGSHGSLHLLWSGEYLRRATETEKILSVEAGAGSVHGCTGAVEVDGLVCYVE